MQQERNERSFRLQFEAATDETTVASFEWRRQRIREGHRGPDNGSRERMEVYNDHN